MKLLPELPPPRPPPPPLPPVWYVCAPASGGAPLPVAVPTRLCTGTVCDRIELRPRRDSCWCSQCTGYQGLAQRTGYQGLARCTFRKSIGWGGGLAQQSDKVDASSSDTKCTKSAQHQAYPMTTGVDLDRVLTRNGGKTYRLQAEVLLGRRQDLPTASGSSAWETIAILLRLPRRHHRQCPPCPPRT